MKRGNIEDLVEDAIEAAMKRETGFRREHQPIGQIVEESKEGAQPAQQIVEEVKETPVANID